MKKFVSVFVAVAVTAVLLGVTASAEAAEIAGEVAEVSIFDQIIDFINRYFGSLGSPFRVFVSWLEGIFG